MTSKRQGGAGLATLQLAQMETEDQIILLQKKLQIQRRDYFTAHANQVALMAALVGEAAARNATDVVKVAAAAQVKAKKTALRIIHENGRAAVKMARDRVKADADVAKAELENAVAMLRTVNEMMPPHRLTVKVAGSGGTRSERTEPLVERRRTGNRLEGTAQQRGFPVGYTGITCAKTKKSCVHVQVDRDLKVQKFTYSTHPRTEDGQFKCPHCDYSAVKGNTLREHYQEHFAAAFSCGDCGGTWCKRTGYSQHFKSCCPRGCGLVRRVQYNWGNHTCKYGVKVMAV